MQTNKSFVPYTYRKNQTKQTPFVQICDTPSTYMMHQSLNDFLNNCLLLYQLSFGVYLRLNFLEIPANQLASPQTWRFILCKPHINNKRISQFDGENLISRHYNAVSLQWISYPWPLPPASSCTALSGWLSVYTPRTSASILSCEAVGHLHQDLLLLQVFVQVL